MNSSLTLCSRFLVRVVIALMLLVNARAAPPQTILVFGDSLSAGYGLAAGEDWPSLISKQLPKSWQLVNASQSGETTDGGLTRLPALLARHTPAIVVIELGANDGLRGNDLELAQHNLSEMIRASQNAGAKVLLVSMQLPPNFGKRYTSRFADMYVQLAKQYTLPPPPFLFEGVADKPNLFQPDQLHPRKEAQPQLASTIWRTLGSMLNRKKPS
ncbi:arylesterase [Burkholderiaceae bacterium DAT-1]|nr:arylesterase [Burkholderiaceae bacterium DAT-1]